MTPPNVVDQDSSCDRSVTFYGYVRGSHMKQGQPIHLIGVGDFPIAEIESMKDPCPLLDGEEKVGGHCWWN